MKTKILNLKGILFEGEAKKVNVKTLSGEITLLDHHQPIISVLQKDSKIWLEDASSKRQDFAAQGGFLHLNGNNELSVLVD
ncbi:MAG TPA: hypothetical protein VJG48_00705 [Candidatus Paceibacterota bacterium]